MDARGLRAGLSEKRPKTATPYTSQRQILACNVKGADSVSQRASRPASARWQTPRRHHNPAMVEGQADGMRRHSPGHVCRRPRDHVSNKAMETGAAASLANYPQLTSSLQWLLKQPVPGSALSAPLHQPDKLVQELGRRATIIIYKRLQREQLPFPAVISGLAKRERGLLSEHVHSRLTCCNQLVTYLNFNI